MLITICYFGSNFSLTIISDSISLNFFVIIGNLSTRTPTHKSHRSFGDAAGVFDVALRMLEAKVLFMILRNIVLIFRQRLAHVEHHMFVC